VKVIYYLFHLLHLHLASDLTDRLAFGNCKPHAFLVKSNQVHL